MNRRKLLLATFIVIALAQLFVPAKMIFDKEDVLKSGLEFRFKTAPIDPNNPFLGKYLTLSFEANTIEVPNDQSWSPGEKIFVSFSKDNSGFAKIASVSKSAPKETDAFVEAKVSSITGPRPRRVIIDYPFERYYLEESKATPSEQIYTKALSDSNRVSYTLVAIKGGDAVIKDIIIDGVSLKNKLKENKKN